MFRLLTEKWHPPMEYKGSFEGQVVLVTGANTGLGLEAAKKIAALKAERLIITTRSPTKGNSTRDVITQWLSDTKSPLTTEIVPLVLDMSSSNGVKTFMNHLSATTSKLDAAILNAGVNMPQYKVSGDGFEETLQVNTVSTIFLATLLLPLLISTTNLHNVYTHLTFVSSRNATMAAAFPSSQSILSSSTPLKVMSQVEGYPSGLMAGQVQYGRSKLMLEYALRRMSRLPALSSPHGRPRVIINSVCPGITKTDLGRNYESWALNFIMKYMFYPLLAKSAAAGANTYLTALCQGEASIGQLWAADQIVPEWEALKSEEGRKFVNKVWEELKHLMSEWNPSVDDVLAEEFGK